MAEVLPREAQRVEDEASLIRAAQRGDEQAFAQLVCRYDRAVLRLAYNLLRSEEDARDIYQEAFLRVHRNLAAFRFDAGFQTWLYRIVTNLCRDFLRRKKVRKEEPAAVQTEDGFEDRLGLAVEQHPEGDPQRRLANERLRERLGEVLEQLTPRERAVFELRHHEGLRLRDIGALLGASEEAAKNCLFRATRKMRAALGEFV